MPLESDKPDLETRIFRGTWSDGSIDVSAGVALLVTGIFWLTGPAVGQSIAPLVGLVLYPILRSKVSEPRIGRVRFGAGRRAKLRRGHWLMIGAGLVALALGVGLFLARDSGSDDSSLARTLVPGLPAALVGLMSIGAAAMLGLSRFLVYAGVLVGAGGAVILLEAHPGWALLAGGIFVTISGLVLMLRFVREYPVVASEIE